MPYTGGVLTYQEWLKERNETDSADVNLIRYDASWGAGLVQIGDGTRGVAIIAGDGGGLTLASLNGLRQASFIDATNPTAPPTAFIASDGHLVLGNGIYLQARNADDDADLDLLRSFHVIEGEAEWDQIEVAQFVSFQQGLEVQNGLYVLATEAQAENLAEWWNEDGDLITAVSPLGNLLVLPIAVAAATHTLGAADAGGHLRLNYATAITLTIPPDSSLDFPVGTVITGQQVGAGAVTVAPGSGVTLEALGGALTTTGPHAQLSLHKVAADTWSVFGALRV